MYSAHVTRAFAATLLVALYAATNLCAGLPIGTQKLATPEGISNGWFGSSLDLDGDTLVVGAPFGRTAYVYRRTSSGWNYADRLLPSGGQVRQSFGASVAVSGDLIVVGDPDFNDLTPGNTKILSGAAFVFRRQAETWDHTATITAVSPANQGYFGGSVAVDRGTIMVSGKQQSAPSSVSVLEESSGTWIRTQELIPSFNDQFGLDGGYGAGIAIDDDHALISSPFMDYGDINSGVVFAYQRVASQWQETQVILPNTPKHQGSFGAAIDLDGEYAIIGAPEFGPGPPSQAPLQGGAYIFQRTGNVWNEVAKLQPSDGFENDSFGTRVAISGNLAAVLSPRPDAGIVHLFAATNGVWSEVDRFLTGFHFDDDQFGIALALDRNTLAVGARLDDAVDSQAGAAYVITIPEPAALAIVIASLILGSCCRKISCFCG